MGREQRRAQQRAERRQRSGRQAQRAAAPSVSTSAPGDPPRQGTSFFKPRWALDIISELKKVTWPSRREVANLTFVVIVVSMLLGAFLGTADLGFSWLVEQTILR